MKNMTVEEAITSIMNDEKIVGINIVFNDPSDLESIIHFILSEQRFSRGINTGNLDCWKAYIKENRLPKICEDYCVVSKKPFGRVYSVIIERNQITKKTAIWFSLNHRFQVIKFSPIGDYSVELI